MRFTIPSMFVLVLVMCLNTTPVCGQVFRKFTEKDGAPEAFVLGIAQDKVGFMWFATTKGLYRYDSRTFKKYSHDPGDPGSIASEYVEKVYIDKRGRLWVATDAGLSLYNRQSDSFILLRHNPNEPRSMPRYNRIKGIAEDQDDNLWVATSFGINMIVFERDSIRVTRVLSDIPHRLQSIVPDPLAGLWVGTTNGLLRFKNGKISPVPNTIAPKGLNPFDVRTATIGKNGILWLGTNRGLVQMDTASKVFHLVSSLKREGESPSVNMFATDNNGKFWLATGNGLAYFDPDTDAVKWYVKDRANPNGLAENTLSAVYLDKQRSLWIGSSSVGISYLNTNIPDFTRWRPVSNSIAQGQTPSGRLWMLFDESITIFGTDIGDSNSFKLKIPNDVRHHSYFLDDRNVLWFAGDDNSINSYDLKTGKIARAPITHIQGGKIIPGMSINRIYVDKRGRVWISGNLLGLLRFDPRTRQFERLTTDLINSFTEDSRSDLWFAGLYNAHLLEAGASNIITLKINEVLKPNEATNVTQIAEDYSGRIWAASEKGLLLYDQKNREFVSYTEQSPELSGNLENLLVDNYGSLWMTSGNKLIRYRPNQRRVQAYDYRESLPEETRLSNSFKDQKGSLFFASDNGIFRLNLANMQDQTASAQVALTSLKLFNKEVKPGDPSGILRQTIETTRELTFLHSQDIFTIDFTLLSYAGLGTNRYAYYLEGFEKDWNYVQTPSATYTNLPAGTYTFLVKAMKGDGLWTVQPLRLKINILPPWWGSWYAYAFYIMVTAGVIYAITHFLWIRSSFRREAALNQVKLDFFTNVSHEIRTHLSLISGPLEKAYQQSAEGKDNAKFLNYARNNSDRLMLLVNELLDFRKIQSGGLRLQVVEHDVIKTVKAVVAAFEHVSREKSINTTLLCPETPAIVWFDIAQMQKVFYNLLSNAYKFTPDGGKITVSIAETRDEVHIAVEDTGKGMSAADLQKLFTYYYQADTDKPGYGIGLALSKSIVEQHHGQLTVKSREATKFVPGSTVLTIHMLRENRHFSPEQIATKDNEYVGSVLAENVAVPVIDSSRHSSQRNSILIIEDNDQLRVFIRELFTGEYKTLEAENGLQGLALANEHIPDIILSDVMMPEINGIELCKRLKSNDNTSHIPVVLLTARTQNEQIIEGLSIGADDYLAKPFDPRILELKIQNLIRVRDDMKTRYRQTVVEEEDSETSTARDLNEAFISKLRALVIENISDTGFGVDQLAFEVGMSLSVLYRKMRLLTGMTINEFVKTIRLNKAKKLLETGVYQVNEVATMVGFEDSKYFSKEFRKAFGKTPVEVKRQEAD